MQHKVRIFFSFLAFCTADFVFQQAQASEIKIDIPGQDKVETITARYICKKPSLVLPSKIFKVTYVNAGATSLAIVPVEKGSQVFSQVISADGARYAADFFEWWVKGKEATLFIQKESKQTVNCTEIKNPKASEKEK